jgi:hypothetical protein
MPNPVLIVLLTLLATALALEPLSGEAATPTTTDPYLRKVTMIVANTLADKVSMIP